MTTRIRIHHGTFGQVERFTVAFPRSAVLARLQQAIPEPAPVDFDPVVTDEPAAAFVRASTELVTIRVYGFSAEAILAEARRLAHAVTCQEGRVSP